MVRCECRVDDLLTEDRLLDDIQTDHTPRRELGLPEVALEICDSAESTDYMSSGPTRRWRTLSLA